MHRPAAHRRPARPCPNSHLTQEEITLSGARAPVPDHHRGPGQRLPPRHRAASRRTARRAAPGVRLDGGTVAHRRRRSPRTSTRCWSSSPATDGTSPARSRRARRAIAEFRIRGVATNLPFLGAVLDDPDFRAGRVTTGVHRRAPGAAAQPARRPTAAAACSRYLAETTVNRPHGPRPQVVEPVGKLPDADLGAAARRRVPAAAAPPSGRTPSPPTCGAARRVAVTDTTFRDAHQSLLATRVRTRDLVAVAPHVARMAPELLQPGVLGRRDLRRGPAVPGRGPVGAARRAPRGRAQHLHADAAARPQHRGLHALPGRRSRTPSSPRPRPPAWTSSGSSTRSTTSRRCARRSTPYGPPAPRSPRSRSATPRTCPTRPRRLYTLDYYLRLAEQIVEAGAHVLAIKDMAGLLRPPAARTLVTALRERFDLPVHLHTHDTAGGQLATLIAAIDAGVDAVDAAVALDGRHDQPAVAVRAGRGDRPHRRAPPGCRCGRSRDLEPYWEAVRKVYAPFESGLRVADRAGLPPRDPRRPAVQPAPAGHRARPGRPLRA